MTETAKFDHKPTITQLNEMLDMELPAYYYGQIFATMVSLDPSLKRKVNEIMSAARSFKGEIAKDSLEFERGYRSAWNLTPPN